MSHLSVAKFGGTSVANHAAMTACAKIVIADPNTRVVVLSASAGVTNLLVALANGVETTEREKLIGEIRQIQENILNELKENLENIRDLTLQLEFAGSMRRAGAKNIEEVLEIIEFCKKNKLKLKLKIV